MSDTTIFGNVKDKPAAAFTGFTTRLREVVWAASEASDVADAIFGKQRNGPTGVVPLVLSQYARFETRADEARREAA